MYQPANRTKLISDLAAAVMTQAPALARPTAPPRPAAHTLPRRGVAIGVILALAAVLRVALFMFGPAVDTTRAVEPDSGRYIELAENLGQYGVFGRARENSGAVHVPLARLRDQRGELESPDANGLRPEIFRTPGYPFFIALFLGLGLSAHWVLAAQAVLGAINVWLVYALGRALFRSPKVAIVAAAILAVSPAAMLANMSLLSETLFSTLILTGILLAVRFRHDMGGAVGAGVFFGAAVMVKPVGVLLGAAVALWMAVTGRSSRAVALALFLAIASILPAAQWMVRNHRVGIGYQISTVPAINALFYTVAYMRIHDAGGDYANDWQAAVDDLFVELRRNIRTDETALQAMPRLAVEQIKQNPKTYGKLMARSSVKFFTDHSTGALMSRLGRPYQPTGMRDRLLRGNFSLDGVKDRLGFAVALGWTGWNLLLALGMTLGALTLIGRRQWTTLLLLGGIMFYFVFTTQVNGLERFRMPVLGIQALLCASVLLIGSGRTLSAVDRRAAS